MFTNLPKQSDNDTFKPANNKKKFLDALPNNFQRKEAIELGKNYNLAERSVGNFLKSCLGKYLTKTKNGFYEKI